MTQNPKRKVSHTHVHLTVMERIIPTGNRGCLFIFMILTLPCGNSFHGPKSCKGLYHEVQGIMCSKVTGKISGRIQRELI